MKGWNVLRHAKSSALRWSLRHSSLSWLDWRAKSLLANPKTHDDLLRARRVERRVRGKAPWSAEKAPANQCDSNICGPTTLLERLANPNGMKAGDLPLSIW